jgi:hypothetical protein
MEILNVRSDGVSFESSKNIYFKNMDFQNLFSIIKKSNNENEINMNSKFDLPKTDSSNKIILKTSKYLKDDLNLTVITEENTKDNNDGSDVTIKNKFNENIKCNFEEFIFYNNLQFSGGEKSKNLRSCRFCMIAKVK